MILEYFDSGVGGDNTVDIVVRALEEFGDTNVLSSPQIMALNNQTALLKVVENDVFFTIQADTTQSQTSAVTTFTTTINTVPVGIVMSVTPQINDNDSIMLNIRPTISRVVRRVNDPNPSLTTVQNSIPVINVREMESLLRLSNGQIAVLGGLIENQENDRVNSIPGLAEREKKEAAKRLKESQERSGMDLTLEEAPSRPETETEAEDSTESQQPEITADQPEQQVESAGDLSLSPIEDEIDTEAPTQKIDLSKMKGPATSGLSLEDKNDLTLDQPDLAEPVEDEETDEETGPEEPVFAINSLSTEEDYISPLEDSGLHELPEQTLEDSGILTRSLDEGKTLQSALSAEELAREMGDDPNAPLPVAAQTVFNASAGQSSKRQFMEWFLFVACFAVLIVAGSIFYYLKTTPEISPPIRPQLAETETATVEQITEQAQVSSDVSGEFTSTETGQEIVLDDSAAQTASIGIPEKPDAIEVADKETIALRQPLPEPKQGQENILPDEIRVEPRVLQISRSRAVRESDLLVHDAYADYKAGNYDSAVTAYQKVLASHPENRDALLGLAAIAQNKGNQQQANQYYLVGCCRRVKISGFIVG
ncbi:MAG: hypothetical protein P8X93_08480, partial [Gammaproteobacteria bacterium]